MHECHALNTNILSWNDLRAIVDSSLCIIDFTARAVVLLSTNTAMVMRTTSAETQLSVRLRTFFSRTLIYLFNWSRCRKIAAKAVDTRRWLELISSTVIETDDQAMAGPMSYASIECDFGIPITRHAVKPEQPVEDHSTTFHLTRPQLTFQFCLPTSLVSLLTVALQMTSVSICIRGFH